MKQIIIKSIRMVNFQAFKDKTVEFSPNETWIAGANATGKSTIPRAFSWLIEGKDQYGRTDFEIKPLTTTGEPIHNVDSEAIAELSVSGEKAVLRKVFHEKWNKPHGKAEQVFNGHETLYYFNRVPVTMREYNVKVEEICPQDLFSLLTNPLHFSKIPWQKRRKLLFDVAGGDVSDEEIASQDKALMELFESINKYKTMDEYRREISSEKRKIKDDQSKIPARVDEVMKTIPKQEEDWEAIEKSISDKSEEIRTIDKEISELSDGMEREFQEYRDKQTEILKKRSALQNIEFEAKKEVNLKNLQSSLVESEKLEKITEYKKEIERRKMSAESLRKERQRLINDRDDLRGKWHELNEAKAVFFLEDEFVCPACNRPFDDSDIEAKKEKLTAQYNEDKAKKLARNVASGKELTCNIDSITENLNISELRCNELSESINILEAEIKSREKEKVKVEDDNKEIQALLNKNPDHKRLLKEIQTTLKSLGAEPVRVSIKDQTDRKEAIQVELTDLIKRLSVRQLVAPARDRIIELEREQKSLAQKIADLEKIEYNIQCFIRAKIETTEEKVNSKFSLVRFKMFNQQVNGELEETCEFTVDGVPFSDLNNAARINGGSDIIKTLSRHYGISCPIFTDNAEAVNEIIPMDAQTIKLYVTTDKELKVISNN